MNFNLYAVILFVVTKTGVFSFRCDRRPYGSTTHSSAPDGRFKLTLADADDTYIPEQVYTVQISVTDEESRFVGYMISAEADSRPDPKNPRRMIPLYPGDIRPISPVTAKFSDRCPYSVEHAISSSKTSVEVYWQAPPSGNGCVTLRAMVSENDEVWYEDGAPLTRKLCEDMRPPDDVAQQLNYECGVCDEAKYEIKFTGIWSRNTHPILFPENDWTPRYSEFIGASHSIDFILWAPGTLATDGLKDLAEHANSSKIEEEMRGKIGDGVRTLIKGKAHGYRKMNIPSYSFFRADKVNHLVTTAVALYPSPDWFLGVTRFELCTEDSTWLQERELSLFPWDAGTDSGVSYESANIETFPQDAVSRVQMSSYDKNSPFYEMDMKDMHPFGKLHIKLVKTYKRECEETTEAGEPGTEETGGSEDNPDPGEPSRYLDSSDHGRDLPVIPDMDSPQECPMSQWQEWSECEGNCEGGKVTGYQWRERYHLVDGVAVEKYDPDAKPGARKSVSEFCKSHYETFERAECEDDCNEDDDQDLSAQRRIMTPISPGHGWISKKRDLPKSKF